MAKKENTGNENETNNSNSPDLGENTAGTAKEEKKVTCKSLVNDTSHIGSRDVILEKGKMIELSQSEATILQHAEKVIVLT